MKGFKDTTKTIWLAGGYAKGGSVNGAAKVSKVMREFKSGELHSGSKDGPKVTNRRQAVAIAMSEAGKSRAPVKKSLGGVLEAGAGYLAGGIPGLLGTLAAQRRRKEDAEAAAARTNTAPATAASIAPVANKPKPQDETTQPMRRGGSVRKADGGAISKLAVKRDMRREQDARTDAVVARGNRMAAEEQPSEALVMRRRGPNEPLIQSSAPPRSLLERKCGGGLAAMPRRK